MEKFILVMWQIFKRITLLFCILSAVYGGATDVLFQHIINTNKIIIEEKETPKLDSEKMFLPLNYFKEKHYKNIQVQIQKLKESNNNFLNFIVFVFITIVIAIFRYLYIGENKSLLKDVFSLKNKEYEVSLFVNVIYNLVFVSLNSYFLYLVINQYYIEYAPIAKFLFYIPLIVLFKHIILWIIFNLFDLHHLFLKNFKILSRVNIAITIFLTPFFFLLSISNKKHFDLIIITIGAILTLTIIVKFTKMVVNNFKYLINQFLYFLIYLVSFELIPIILPYIFIQNYIK